MTAAGTRGVGSRPLVVLVCRVPLVAEAVVSALDEIADVHVFPGGRGGLGGLLRSLGPDAVVVDGRNEAAAAEEYAVESGVPVVEIELTEQRLKVHGDDGWESAADGPPSPEAIRNVLIGRIFGREALRERG
jgi:hypothetical protein